MHTLRLGEIKAMFGSMACKTCGSMASEICGKACHVAGRAKHMEGVKKKHGLVPVWQHGKVAASRALAGILQTERERESVQICATWQSEKNGTDVGPAC